MCARVRQAVLDRPFALLRAMPSWTPVSPRGIEIYARMRKRGLGKKKIADFCGRSTETIARHLAKNRTVKVSGFRKKVKGVGRPLQIPPSEWPQIERGIERLIAKADSLREVTAAMIIKSLRLKCNERTLRREFKKQGVSMRPLYSKPDLSPGDTAKRFAFARKHRSCGKTKWRRSLRAVIDNKRFQVYLKGKTRDTAARRRVRGAYRARV